MFVATSILLLRQNPSFVEHVYVATKMILMAAPANDTLGQDSKEYGAGTSPIKCILYILYLFPQESQDSKQDDTIVIYNRVPKTGSTSFAGIVYELCKSNKFNVIHINITKNAKTLALSDQVSLSTIVVVVVVLVVVVDLSF